MPIGAGGAPAGSSAAGYGVPDKATVPNNAPLPDMRTGLPQTGRFIDPVSKSYLFTTDGRVVGDGTVPQRVKLALTQVRGSSCVPTDGQTFASITEKQFDFKNRVAAAVSQALAELVKARLVRIVSIDVFEPLGSPDAGIGAVRWQDLTTGQFDRTTIGP
jgi:hypothetical protein